MTDTEHEFQPQRRDARNTTFVIAHCACGWTGGDHPVGLDAYAEAQLEYDQHVDAADEPERPRAPADPRR